MKSVGELPKEAQIQAVQAETLTKETTDSVDGWLDSWHVSPSANRTYDFIDGLRGIAILMVLACHHFYFNLHSGQFVLFLRYLGEACGGGVTLFFALSGFLISWPFWRRKCSGSEAVTPPGYGWRRFWKIYPPVALSVLVFTPAYILLTKDWSYLSAGLKWIAGIPFVLPVSGKFNPVMWTLIVEVQFYALLPLLFFCFKKVPTIVTLWVFSILFLVVPACFRALTGLSVTLRPEIDVHFPSALDGFGLGVLIAGLESAGLRKGSWAKFGYVGLILWPVALLLTAWLRTRSSVLSFGTVEVLGAMERIASACLLCYITEPRHFIARLLCAPWLRWCGIVSYEWYLLHQPITLWGRRIFGPADGSIVRYAGIVGGSFLISTCIAAAVYRWFSLPILKRGRASAGIKHFKSSSKE